MEMNIPPILQFQNVSKLFPSNNAQKIPALDNISFSLYPQQFITIIGPSGCGKSTLLRLAAGLDQPSAGYIVYHDKTIHVPDKLRGLVFQNYSIFPWLTVRQNIEFGLKKSDIRLCKDKVDHWLSVIGLKEFAEAYPKTLSGGMKQRVALADS
jgi:NitT/TauT family transport system ATP-binding protein